MDRCRSVDICRDHVLEEEKKEEEKVEEKRRSRGKCFPNGKEKRRRPIFTRTPLSDCIPWTDRNVPAAIRRCSDA